MNWSDGVQIKDYLLGNEEEADPTESLVQSAYQVLKKQQRPAPKQYYFLISNKETTLRKAPPSPCKVCSSPHHWDKECPFWNKYLKHLKRKLVQLASLQVGEDTSPTEAYQTAYQVLTQVWEYEGMTSSMEDNGKINSSDKGKTTNSILTAEACFVVSDLNRKEEGSYPFKEKGTTCVEVMLSEMIKPYLVKQKKILHKHNFQGGKSAVGISVLAVQGCVGNLQNEPIYLRHDSCADMSLIFLEYYHSLINPPSIKKGTKMNLWQLTDKDSKIKGYVSMPIFTVSEQGKIIETEVEAYLVPHMSVPILLREDYQLNYELTVKRNTKNGVTILYGDDSKHSLKASAVDKTEDFRRLKASVQAIQSFVKAKNHRCKKNKCKRRALHKELPVNLVLANNDIRIPAQALKQVEITLPKGGKSQWIIKRNMIPNSPSTYFLVPNTLIEVEATTVIYVTNPTDAPRIIRKGDAIATVHHVEEYFDHPIDNSQHEEMDRTALLMEKLLSDQSASDDDRTSSDEGGPKTADLPDLNEYPSSQIRELLDVGDLPVALQEKAWAMLSQHIKAFRFNRKLGDYPVKARIRTVDGANPISLPMYASSPAKKQFINQQIDMWYAKGIIEPSRSLWGAPVVIAY